jgi:hypothetical protein
MMKLQAFFLLGAPAPGAANHFRVSGISEEPICGSTWELHFITSTVCQV